MSAYHTLEVCNRVQLDKFEYLINLFGYEVGVDPSSVETILIVFAWDINGNKIPPGAGLWFGTNNQPRLV